MCVDIGSSARMKTLKAPPGAGRAAKIAAGLWLALSLVYLLQLSRVPIHVRFDWATELRRLRWWLIDGGLGMFSMTESSVMDSPLATAPVPIEDIAIIEGTWDEVKAALGDARHHPIVVVRGFSRGTALDEFRTMERFLANTNNTEHVFSSTHLGQNQNILAGDGSTRSRMGLHDAVRSMAGGERLYGGFIMNLMQRKVRLKDAVVGALSRLAEVPSLKTYYDANDEKSTVYHSFVYHGAWHWAMLHNAPIPDAFLQIANRKKWYFTLPEYIPHMRPVCLGGTACRFMMDPRDQDRIPFREVVTGPGDLLVFPRYWPHAVANLDEEFGLAVGVRPLRIDRDVRSLANPAGAERGQFWPTANFLLRIAAMVARRARDTVKTEGDAGKTEVTQELSHPQLEAVARGLGERLGLNHPLRAGGHDRPYKGPPEMEGWTSGGEGEL